MDKYIVHIADDEMIQDVDNHTLIYHIYESHTLISKVANEHIANLFVAALINRDIADKGRCTILVDGAINSILWDKESAHKRLAELKELGYNAELIEKE